MSQPRRRHDPEFRAGAVRIVRETRRPISEIACDLGPGAASRAESGVRALRPPTRPASGGRAE